MKNKIYVILIFLFSYTNIYAQNLLMDGSFEDDTMGCPVGFDISSQYWTEVLLHEGTPNQYHPCVPSVPYNIQGYQESYHGIAYCGLNVYCNSQKLPSNMRCIPEYLVGRLSQPLEKDKCYRVSFMYSLADNSAYAISNLGIYFSADRYAAESGYEGTYLSYIEPQIVVNQYLNDTLNWVKIERYYRAEGGERYITFGNFKREKDTDTMYVSDNFIVPGVYVSYVYLDDVWVEEVDAATLPEINLGNDTVLCVGEEITLKNIMPEGTVYVWDKLSNDTIYTINQTGLYKLEAYNGCSYSSDSIYVYYLEDIDIGRDTVLCEREFKTLSNNFNSPQMKYLWSTGSTDSTIIGFVDVVTDTNIFWLEINNGRCQARDTITLTKHVPENSIIESFYIDTSYCIWAELQAPRSASYPDKFMWNTEDTTESIRVYKSDLYRVHVSNECYIAIGYFRANVETTEQGYNPSNIFTPNGDGINDILLLYEGNSEMFELSIYNRWGKLIWQTQDPSQSWDGEGISDGVYHYELRFRNCAGDMIEKKGSVSVVK